MCTWPWDFLEYQSNSALQSERISADRILAHFSKSTATSYQNKPFTLRMTRFALPRGFFFLVCGILSVRFHLSFFVGIKTRYNWTVTQSHITTPTTTKQPIELRNIHILQIYFWQCHEHPSPNSHSFTSATLSKDVIDILEDMLVVHERCWSVHLTCIFLLPAQQISRVFQISKSFDHDRRRWIRQ